MTWWRRRTCGPGALLAVFALALAPVAVSADRQHGATRALDPAVKAGMPARVVVPGAGALGEGRSTAILGAAWHADNTPIPSARVRLRSVLTGRIQAHAVASETGQFEFHGVEPGSYVIELVSEDGDVLTVGHTFTVAPGETVATFIRLGTKVPWFDGFFANAAAAIATTAAATGVTAVAPEEVRPVSARR